MWYPSRIHKTLLLPESFSCDEEFPMKTSETVIERKCEGKTSFTLFSSIRFFAVGFFFETPRSSPWNFLVLWDKKDDGKTWYPPSHPWTVFATRNFLKHRSVPNESFRIYETKEVDGKTWSPSRIHKMFSLLEVFWNNTEFLVKKSETVIQNNCDGKTWYPPVSSM